jgi:hypothetical protein
MASVRGLETLVQRLQVTPLRTNAEARAVAAAFGYKPVRGPQSHGQLVFTNGSNFISPNNITSTGRTHNGGVWKMASSARGLQSKDTRLGTYSRGLNYMGK